MTTVRTDAAARDSVLVPHEVPARILGLVASGAVPACAWLDGGVAARGWFGAWPDRVVQGDAPELLERVWASARAEPERVWIGRIDYDWGADRVRGRVPGGRGGPGFELRRYPALLVLEPDRVRVLGDPQAAAELEHALAAAPRAPSPAWPWTTLTPVLAPDRYRARVRAALVHIAAGDSYQINLSQAFVGAWRPGLAMDPAVIAAAYAWLRARSPATMGALMPAGARWFLSNSPETLLRVDRGGAPQGDRARAWPIKGTRPRHPEPDLDDAAAAELRASTKDRAEHVMIVDLVRNDLGRLARPGTVVAPRVPTPMRLPHVHHLVSEIRADVDPGVSLLQWLDGLFPGGSITGAPKRRTIEIIDALEGEPRGLYCGSLVVLEPGGLTLSIAIRTAEVSPAGLHVRGGGGIVIDSDPEAERQETIAKVRAFAGPDEG